MPTSLARLTLSTLLAALTTGAPALAQGEGAPSPGGGQPVLTEPVREEESLPEAEALFERHIEALGGREKVFSIENRRITGVFEGSPFEFPARITSWLETPDKMRSKISEPAGRTIILGYDGRTAWRQINEGEVVILEGDAAHNIRDSADFHGQANYEKRYKSIRTVGVGDLLGRKVYVVRAVWHSGDADHVLFDRESGLYVGVQTKVEIASGEEIEVMTVVDGYKEFGGVKYPTKITQMTAEGKVLARYDYRDVKVNVEDGFDDFSPPGGAPAASAETEG